MKVIHQDGGEEERAIPGRNHESWCFEKKSIQKCSSGNQITLLESNWERVKFSIHLGSIGEGRRSCQQIEAGRKGGRLQMEPERSEDQLQTRYMKIGGEMKGWKKGEVRGTPYTILA